MNDYSIQKIDGVFRKPIYRINILCEYVSTQGWQNYLRDYCSLFDQEGQFYIIMDIKQMAWLPLTKCKQLYEILNSLKEKIKLHLLASTIIINGETAKKFVNCVLSMYDNERPLKICNNEQEAYDFIKKY